MNRSHAWLDTVASFGLEYERALGPAGHLKDKAGWLGVNWLSGLRSTQEAVVPRGVTDVEIVLDRESARLPPDPRCERSCSEWSQCVR